MSTITGTGAQDTHTALFRNQGSVGIHLGTGLASSTVTLERKLSGQAAFSVIATYTSPIDTNIDAPAGSQHRFNCTIYGSGSAEAVISG